MFIKFAEAVERVKWMQERKEEIVSILCEQEHNEKSLEPLLAELKYIHNTLKKINVAKVDASFMIAKD